MDEKEKTWTTIDGKRLLISEMTTAHIINALNMMKRNGGISQRTLDFYLTCPTLNGEGAQDAFDAEFSVICGCPVYIQIDWMEEELEKRGVKL